MPAHPAGWFIQPAAKLWGVIVIKQMQNVLIE